MGDCKALIGRDCICEYLGVNKNVFYDLVERGAPIVRQGARWISHKEMLDEFFRQQVVILVKGKESPP